MSRHRLPPLRTVPIPVALSSRNAIEAHEKLRKAKAELEKWQAAFDCHRGNDSDRLRLEIRLAEQRVAAACLELKRLDPFFDPY
jgi:hypothetical protein